MGDLYSECRAMRTALEVDGAKIRELEEKLRLRGIDLANMDMARMNETRRADRFEQQLHGTTDPFSDYDDEPKLTQDQVRHALALASSPHQEVTLREFSRILSAAAELANVAADMSEEIE